MARHLLTGGLAVNMTSFEPANEPRRRAVWCRANRDEPGEEIRRLAETLAHHLGTALSVVLGRADMLIKGEVPPDEVAPTAKIIKERAEAMGSVIHDLLDYGRRNEVVRGRATLKSVVERAMTFVEQLAERTRVHLVIAAPHSRSIRVQGDSEQLARALANILKSSIRAMPGGGTLTATIEGTICPSPDDAGGDVRSWHVVRILDTGDAVPEDALDSLFHPFSATDLQGRGGGLGLLIACAIIEDHGGWISVESEPDEGFELRVHLPVEVSE